MGEVIERSDEWGREIVKNLSAVATAMTVERLPETLSAAARSRCLVQQMKNYGQLMEELISTLERWSPSSEN